MNTAESPGTVRVLWDQRRSQTRNRMHAVPPNNCVATLALRDGSMWK